MLNKRIFSVILLLILAATSVFVIPATADSASVSAPSQAYIGDEITVTLTFQCTSGSNKLGAIDATLSFDSTVLTCTSNPSGTNADGSGKYLISYYNAENTSSKHSMTFKFKCNKAGTAGIHVSAQITDTELSGAPTQKEYYTTIKVIDKSTLSGNAKLKKLVLSAGTLSPAFDPDITNYDVKVDYSVTQVLISADTQEEASKIDVQGSSSMKVGNNIRTVVVTAPNGTVKKYTLNITRASSGETVPPVVVEPTVNPYEITVDGEKKYMVGDYSAITAPKGFEASLYNINETDIPVLKDAVSDRIVVYATNIDDTVGMFYLYDKENGTFSPFRYLEVANFDYIVLDYNEKALSVEGYQYAKVTVDNYTVNGFVYNDSSLSDFVIFYAENSLGGKEFYRYDKKDKTVQRAADFVLQLNKITDEKQERTSIIDRFFGLQLKDKLVVISGLIIIVIIIVLIIIIIIKATAKTPSAESIEAAKEQEFMEGFGEVNHLYLDDDYEQTQDASPLDEDFVMKEDENNNC